MSGCNVPSEMDTDLNSWFVREILPNEAALTRYLMRMWHNREEVQDLRQETYTRVCEAAARSRPTSPKSFLFTTARNLMADRLRRERVVSIEAWADMDAANVKIDENAPEQHASALQQLRHLAEVFDGLPPKCRAVVWMRRVESFSQREVAIRLGITEGTVEKHVAKGVRLLADGFYAFAPAAASQDGMRDDEVESEHGQSPGN